jgi:hypothetical protein
VVSLGWIAIVSNVGRENSHRLLLPPEQILRDIAFGPCIDVMGKPIGFDQRRRNSHVSMFLWNEQAPYLSFDPF